ncbi:DUF262 domain-containing protein [Streptosporangium sandarakinum]|uniref:GmrSD restriction endonucleases N-terminal domain-containing protein n=1 Tax=Streptosporangium sandarakinum TaxID=1260955 RepID=A0A852V6X0_9ACTN|nr:DUF262 domain-containing protein [Streptosporangium sandarakinum]NYF43896.1 hypothetical protein [Streptosporangium sandarakinum]
MRSAQDDVLFEYDSAGASTGVELEVIEAIDEPFDPELIDVVTRNPTVDLLLSRIRTGMIDLAPDFQRKAGIWNEKHQSRLIESLLLRIPLPTLYASEDEDDVWVIVDGIQRLTAIRRFVDPSGVGREQLFLQGLEYLQDYDGCAFDDLPGRLQLRLRETELVVHLIRRGTPEAVKFNIFARINTGGLPLSRQELRHALIPGRARTLLGELAESESFLRATDKSVNPERMADREMVLRFIAFRLVSLASYTYADFDHFLRESMRTINKMTRDDIQHIKLQFARGMDAAHYIFGPHAFRKRYRGVERRFPINKALFETVAVNLAKRTDEDLALLMSRRDLVQVGLVDLLTDYPDFERAISQSTGDHSKVRLRFDAVRDLFDRVIND